MSVSVTNISWGSYQKFSGPVFYGKIPYSMPENPDFDDKVMAVTCLAEGGKYDAINMYDSCIVTVGISQLCLRVHVLERLIGRCFEADPHTIESALLSLPVPAGIRKNGKGEWRFHFLDGRDVETSEDMKEMFFGGCSGISSEWTSEGKQAAKEVAVIFANIWDSAICRKAQADWTKKNIPSFLTPDLKKALPIGTEGFQGALRAAVNSFSINNPAASAKLFLQASSSPDWDELSDEERFTHAMKKIVLESPIKIWPERYKKIESLLERAFGVSLPSIEELKGGEDLVDSSLKTLKGVQEFLVSQGFDLGPKAADGVFGKKTSAALVNFQMKHSIQVTGIVDSSTLEAMTIIVRMTGLIRS